MRVLGADVAAGRWVGVVLDDARSPWAVSAVCAPTLTALADAAQRQGPLDAVGLDIPIGLPGTGVRQAESLARARVGGRASSVFTVPVRAAVTAATYGQACEVNRALAGTAVSRQSYALSAMILQADAWVRACGLDAVEVHPEVSFAQMAGAPLSARKKSWAGALARHGLLTQHGITLSGDLGQAGRLAAVDDVLDAAAVAWTARRRAHGSALSLPDPPQDVGDGWPAAIWV